jgi:phosphoglycolate phosphatase
MMPVRALLFDFDGTLADSFAAITASTNHVRHSIGLPVLSEAEVRGYVGHGLGQLLTELAPGLPTATAIERYRAHHEATMHEHTQLYPGVEETLTALAGAGYKLGVCSNKAVPFTRSLVQSLGLAKLLPVVLGPEDADGKPKPDPTMLLRACEQLGVLPDETIYVGDMSVDVLAGRAAGIPVWLVHVGQAGRDDPRVHGPAMVLEQFADIRLALLHAGGM